MSYDTIRAEMVTVLGGVSGIGQIHDFRRHTKSWDEFFARHKSGAKVNNWEITRAATTQEISSVQGLGGNEPFFHDTHAIIIEGVMSLNDANETEKIFQTLVSDIIKEFRLDTTLNGKLIRSVMMQGPTMGHRTFGGVLVHFANLVYSAVERVGG